MYKLLLSWRYLRTRYLALASIISVMLGVATLIVVNSVMGGFSTKLRERMRGIQADVSIESRSHDGFDDYHGKMQLIEQLVGDKVEAMAPVIETGAMLQFRYRKRNENGIVVEQSEPITRLVRIVGIDPVSKSRTGDFAQHLMNPEHREDPSRCFTLRGEAEARYKRNHLRPRELEFRPRSAAPVNLDGPPPLDPPTPPPEVLRIDAAVVGFGIATYRKPDAQAGDANKDVYILEPGDEILVATMTRSDLKGFDGASGFAKPIIASLVVTDLYRSEMSEYDSNLVFMDIRDLQRLRAMYGCATGIQLKLKNYDRDAKQVVDTLSKRFDPGYFLVQTWEHKQGPLLAAISIERGILNILLFLIIAVAGFGILAIFLMLVVEKTRDIGILKSLGASNSGVMGIFLSYGLALGLVGAALGTALGVAITVNINAIEQFIARMTGQDVFPRSVYNFDRIPTDMQFWSILLVNLGAVLIAVGASVFPALRAAMLHPVRALRYE